MWGAPHKTGELLDLVAEELGCNYLSNLREDAYRRGLYGALKSCPAERFPARDWSDAADYLTGEPVPEGLTADQVKKLLLGRLKDTAGERPAARGGSGM